MSKLLITTRADNNVDYIAELTHPLFKDYAERCGADFLVLDNIAPAEGDDNVAVYRIMQHYDLHDTYERILCLDTDIIINKNSPNIFDYVPEDKIGCTLEDTVITERIKDRREAIEHVQKKWKDIGWKSNYINSGVFLTSRMHRDIFQSVDGEYWTGRGSDDIHLGYQIHKNGYEIFRLPFQYNHTGLYSEARGGGHDRMNSYFLHYAGGKQIKEELFYDWNRIYG